MTDAATLGFRESRILSTWLRPLGSVPLRSIQVYSHKGTECGLLGHCSTSISEFESERERHQKGRRRSLGNVAVGEAFAGQKLSNSL